MTPDTMPPLDTPYGAAKVLMVSPARDGSGYELTGRLAKPFIAKGVPCKYIIASVDGVSLWSEH